MKTRYRAEELLYFFLYAAEPFVFPSYRSWCDSYESWLYRHRLLDRVHWLERQKFLETDRKADTVVHRITQAGREAALGGRDPERYWGRSWDGKWRLFVFDLPVHRRAVRPRLLRWLRQRGFGYLQDSVWIHPDPVPEITATLKDFRDDVESFVMLKAECELGFSNEAIVRGAWRVEEMRLRYDAYLEDVKEWRARLRRGPVSPAEAFQVIRAERAAWLAAMDLDPLLPQMLWPRGYLGLKAWERRQEYFRLLAQLPHRRPK